MTSVVANKRKFNTRLPNSSRWGAAEPALRRFVED
jgi:hypothetical protein